MLERSETVLDRFQPSDLDAFETLFREHQHNVYRWILRIVRDRGAAEDLTVDTFWRVWNARTQFDTAHDFEPWARRIATHAALDWLRAQRRKMPLTAWDVAEIPAVNAGDPAVAAEVRSKIAEAIARLPPRLRVAVVLSVIEEQPHKDVAAALGISITAVKLRVFRGLRLLRKDLERRGIKP